MPTYDYRREDNGAIFEVSHAMSLSIATWGELCEAANMDPGDVAVATPVTKLLRTGGVIRESALRNPDAPPCVTGGGCTGGGCGL